MDDKVDAAHTCCVDGLEPTRPRFKRRFGISEISPKRTTSNTGLFCAKRRNELLALLTAGLDYK